MKRCGWFLVFLVHLCCVDLEPAASQPIGGPPAAARATPGQSYHEKMCARMCGQHGKAKQVCGANGKTFDNACSAKCAKVAYKPGPCPTPAQEERVAAAPPAATQSADEPIDQRLVGHIKWFNPDKKYGFILGADGQEVYLEQAAFADQNTPAPQEGARVRFEIKPGPQGLHATNVSVITEEEEAAAAERRQLIAQGLLDEEPTPTPPPRIEPPREAVFDEGVYVIPSQ